MYYITVIIWVWLRFPVAMKRGVILTYLNVTIYKLWLCDVPWWQCFPLHLRHDIVISFLRGYIQLYCIQHKFWQLWLCMCNCITICISYNTGKSALPDIYNARHLRVSAYTDIRQNTSACVIANIFHFWHSQNLKTTVQLYIAMVWVVSFDCEV